MLYLLLFAASVVSDQITKHAVLAHMSLGETIEVFSGFFNLTYVLNYGAAFGLFAGLPDGVREAALGASTVIALVVVVWLIRHPDYQSSLTRSGISLVLGGAVGNIIDRVRVGAVIDFLDFSFRGVHWPAFNIADSSICIGVVLLICCSGKRSPTGPEESV